MKKSLQNLLATCTLLSIVAAQATTTYYAVNTTPHTVYVGLFSMVGDTLTDYKKRKMYSLHPGIGASKPYALFELPVTTNLADQHFVFSANRQAIDTMLTTGQIPIGTKLLFVQPVEDKTVFEIHPLKERQHEKAVTMVGLASHEKPRGTRALEKAEINLSGQKEVERLKKLSSPQPQEYEQEVPVTRIVEQRTQKSVAHKKDDADDDAGVVFHTAAKPSVTTLSLEGQEMKAKSVAAAKPKPVEKKKSRWSLFK